jgi:hypothetical protein
MHSGNARLVRLGNSWSSVLKCGGLAAVMAAGCLLAVNAFAADKTAPRRLKVSDNGRWLVYQDGTPFFYLGDTAWELFHRLNREESELYLRDRAAKGFTVIQAVVLAELDGLKTPNAYGDIPLLDNDPTKPNEAYFRHVDWVVEKAESLGLFIGMLPTWGDKWNRKWGVGPEIFTPENAQIYGRWLGQRYKDRQIIWILGGDRSVDNDRHRQIIRAMARGLAEGDGGTHLMTFHPQGDRNSAEWFHEDDWLSFNMFQSGHGSANKPNYEMTLAAYNRKPVKPVLDGEPRYEDHPINWKAPQGWFDQWDVRQAAYWSMLSGACGHTYGDHNIWQMWQEGRKPISSARTPWRKALQHPGSAQMGMMRRLFESRPWQSLIPDQTLIQGENPKGPDHVRAARAADGSFAFVYIPTGKSLTVNTERIAGGKLAAWWFDPRSGKASAIAVMEKPRQHTFDPPGEPGRGNDWVLVLDDASRGFGPPGEK